MAGPPELLPAELPAWDDVARGGTLDLARLVADPAIRFGARVGGVPLPTRVPRHARLPVESPVGQQLRGLYTAVAGILADARAAGGADQRFVTPEQFLLARERLDTERLRPALGEPRIGGDPQPPPTRAELLARLRQGVSGKRGQRTRRP